MYRTFDEHMKYNSELIEGEAAYAKLVADNGKSFYVKELLCLIGRENRNNDPTYF